MTLHFRPIATGQLFQISHSPNPIPPLPTSTSIERDRTYYNQFLPSALPPWNQLKEALSRDDLQICISNNISNPTAPGKTSYWTMTSPILSLSGTTNPTTNTTRYRAELTSILTILYIIYWTEQEHPPSNPFTVAIQCSNQKALKEAFCESPLGVTTANQPNHDLIMDIRFLRNLIRTHFKPFLGENHVNKSPPSPIESDYSAFQDFLINPNPKHKAAAKDQTPLSHVITILLQGQPIQQDLRSTLHTLEYAFCVLVGISPSNTEDPKVP